MKTIRCKNTILGEGMPKIAVPISPSSADEARCLAAKVRAAGADLMEFRADTCSGDPSPEEILVRLSAAAEVLEDIPILFTFRTVNEGGSREYADREYADLLIKAAGSGLVDLIDLEYERDNAQDLLIDLKELGIPVVLSYHDFHGVPSLEELCDRLTFMEMLGADIAKIACMPAASGDAERVQAASACAMRTLQIPFVLIAMGEKGEASRLSAEVFGSAFTFGCLPGRMSAPGQYDTETLKKELLKVHEVRSGTGAFVFLTGFMGTGKSTTAQILSRMTGKPVIEMDERIEAEAGMKISGIFEKYGEPAFRAMETALLAGLYREEGAIVSCGGGLVLRRVNVELMKALGTTVLLTAEPETLLARLRDEAENRPMLKGRLSVEGISELMERRREHYEAAADFRVATDGKTEDKVAVLVGEVTGEI